MEIVTYEDVTDEQITKLNLSCFGGVWTGDFTERIVENDPRVPDWGGQLYAVDDGEVLGEVSHIRTKARTEEGKVDVGAVTFVGVLPSRSREGIATKLMEETHRRMIEGNLKYSILATSKSLVAYKMYKNLGYADILRPLKAFKKTENVTSCGINFDEEDIDPEYIRSVFHDNVERLYGLVVREKEFWEGVKASNRSEWIENTRIARDGDGNRVGYVLFKERDRCVECDEIGAERPEDLKRILKKVGEGTGKTYITLSPVNPNHLEVLREEGFRCFDDVWSRVMLKKLGGETSEGIVEKFGSKEGKFYSGIFEGIF